MTIPDYQLRDSFAIYAQNNARTIARIMLLKILTQLVPGCVTFCFDNCFVKHFLHGSSMIIQFKIPISNLEKCHSTRRRNY